tara:strand:+ start:637 stop:903 length:267 start_codon:yes stop_codon:yes gene_type:complete
MDPIDQELQDSQRAKELLDDPLIQKIFQELESKYIDAWKDSDPKDREGREVLFQLQWAIGQVRNHFNVIIEKGDFHKSALSRSMKRKF